MIKRIHLFILVIATLFCGCKGPNSHHSASKVSFSIPARVLEKFDNNNEDVITVCTDVFQENNVIISKEQQMTLRYDDDNKPYLNSIVLNEIPLFTPLVFKMKIFLDDELFAFGQSNETIFSRDENKLDLKLSVIPQKIEPGLILSINQPEITVEEWQESVTFIATEGFDSYSWICGEQISTEKEFVVDISNLEIGNFDVILVATKNGKEYCATSKLNVISISSALKINQTEVIVEEWQEKTTFTATEGFDSYNWTCGEQTGTENEFIIDVSKLKVGEYDVVVTAKKGTKEYEAVAKLKVEELSIVLIINQSEITVSEKDEKATFTATEGFDSYNWSCGEQTGTGNEFIIDITKLKVGEYDVVVTAKKGTKEYTATAKLKVEAFVTLVINQSEIKVSETEEKATFTATEGFDSYNWSCDNQTGTGSEFAIDIAKLKVGEYNVTLKATKDGKEYEAAAKLKVEELSIVLIINQSEITVSEKDEKATFTATEGFDSYNWSCGEQTGTGNEFIIDITKLKVGEYDVVVTAKKGTKEYTATAKLKVEAFVTLVINQSEIKVSETEEKATFTATEGFDSYNWSCDNQTGTGSEFAIDIAKLKVGEYNVTLKATKDGKEYEAAAKLKVEELSIVLQISETNVTVEEWKESTEFTATEGFDGYTWEVVDTNTNETKLSQTGEKNKFVVTVSQLQVGKYNVNVTAVKGTKTYTKTTTLEVIAFATGLEIQQGNVTVEEWKESTEFIATEGFESYTWEVVDTNTNETKLSQTSEKNEFVVTISDLQVGKYNVSVTAVKGTKTYTKTTTLEVTAFATVLQIQQGNVVIEEWKESTEFTATEGFDSYTWEVVDTNTNETKLSKTSEKNKFVIDISQLQVGKYNVSVTAVKGTKTYTKTTTLEVTAFATVLQIQQGNVVIGEGKQNITFTATSGYDNYSWTCDGEELIGEESSITIDISTLSVGEHEIKVTAIKGTITHSVSTTLTVNTPSITLQIEQSDVIVENTAGTTTFTATEGFDSYNWTCGDQTQTGSKSSFTIVKTSLREGVYIVRLIATKDGIEYSAETSLTVVKPSGSSGISFEVVHTDVTIAVEEDDNDILFATDFGYDSYKWIIAGKDDYDNSPFCSISKDSLGEGVYIVRLIATKDGREYSAEGRVSIELPKRSPGISFEVVHTDITIAVAEERDNAILFETDFGYDSYKWIIAGKDDYDNSPFCPIIKDSLCEGVYIVRLIATKDGREYSAVGKLTVDLPNITSGFSIDVVENDDIYFDVYPDDNKITFVTYENCDSYYWTCGDKSGNEKTFTIEKSDFNNSATYLIRLVVYKDGREYSCQQLFSISEL